MISRWTKMTIAAASAALLAACADEPEPAPTPEPVAQEAVFQPIQDEALFRRELVGRTLFLNGASVAFGPDGAFRGSEKGGAPAGRWAWRGGQLCLETVAGAGDLPSGCYDIAYDGDEVRMTGAGRTIFADVG